MTTEGMAVMEPGNSYNILLELNMPDSENNLAAGPFTISSIYHDKVMMVQTLRCRCAEKGCGINSLSLGLKGVKGQLTIVHPQSFVLKTLFTKLSCPLDSKSP